MTHRLIPGFPLTSSPRHPLPDAASGALLALAAVVGFAPVVATAQAPSGHHVIVPTIPADPADVGSIDAIVRAYYAVITGPAGQPRQWARDRTLYWPGTRFFAASVTRDDKPRVDVMTPQEFDDRTDSSFVADGFDEHEIHRLTHRIGNVAHIMSTYETRRAPGGPITGRGVNSLELYWDGTRWWITAASWDDERPNSPIPREMLP